MTEGVLREVTLALPMVPEMELEASKTAAAVAESIRMNPDRIDEVRMAVVEACINALEHSQASKVFMTLQVVGERNPEKLRIMVQDNGKGFDPKQAPGRPPRGHGLKIIRGLMDEVEIRSGPEGTTVVMSRMR
ncbi:MAG TPA: ATP-binding protein [Thermoanaerobaculia bacterium]|jgi:serine/threonine-protein kinase RsbW|nr:ATP-binding protein [Thermoanaerobaculia bacterium]